MCKSSNNKRATEPYIWEATYEQNQSRHKGETDQKQDNTALLYLAPVQSSVKWPQQLYSSSDMLYSHWKIQTHHLSDLKKNALGNYVGWPV